MSDRKNPLISRLRDPKVTGHKRLREEAALEIELLQDRVARLRSLKSLSPVAEKIKTICESSVGDDEGLVLLDPSEVLEAISGGAHS